jgi:hypothetical protein
LGAAACNGRRCRSGERHAEPFRGGRGRGLVGIGVGAAQAVVDVRRDQLDAELSPELRQRQ